VSALCSKSLPPTRRRKAEDKDEVVDHPRRHVFGKLSLALGGNTNWIGNRQRGRAQGRFSNDTIPSTFRWPQMDEQDLIPVVLNDAAQFGAASRQLTIRELAFK
jgi:hypothetical protein